MFLFLVILASTLTTPKGEIINIKVVSSINDQIKGLSGVKKLASNEGMLFFYNKDDDRTFWMFDTYLDLDIFFLDKNFKIIEIERKMKKSPSKTVKGVATTRTIRCRHVLELEASTKISLGLKKGDLLKHNP